METKHPVAVDRPVRWGDMDAFQHVNNTVYFRWFECARLEYFQAVGFDAAEALYPYFINEMAYYEKGIAFALATREQRTTRRLRV